jgi:hypothetical protein
MADAFEVRFRPERTVLYHALAHHLERFLLIYEECFQPTHGYLHSETPPSLGDLSPRPRRANSYSFEVLRGSNLQPTT